MSFAHTSIRHYFDAEHTIATYLKELTEKTSNVIGEIRHTLEDGTLPRENKIRDIGDHCLKIVELKSNLFETIADSVYYVPEELPIIGDRSREIIAANRLWKSISTLETVFNDELVKIKEIHSATSNAYTKKGKRIPSRASFELLSGKGINLRAAYKYLVDKEHPFIISVYDDFETAFSGNPVKRKVIWSNMNALHYFIDRIHGKGVKRANEGKWERASRCFQVLDKSSIPMDFTPHQIKDRDDISSSTTALLEKAIAPFLK